MHQIRPDMHDFFVKKKIIDGGLLFDTVEYLLRSEINSALIFFPLHFTKNIALKTCNVVAKK